MRVFTIAADVIMGLILGLFVYVLLSRTWTGLQHPGVAAIVIAAALIVVLFRRPNGSLARRAEGRPTR
jgi:ABC-type branched-subunit amino acid transport system permease subunit